MILEKWTSLIILPATAGLSLRAVTRNTCYELSMLDFPLMLQMRLPVVDRIRPQSNKFATDVENKAIGDSKDIDSPVQY